MGEFNKYELYGAYHWRGIDRSLRGLFGPFSLFDYTRYGKIIQSLGPAPTRVLEVGCGDGALTHCMARAGHEVWGFDLEPRGIDLAKSETSKFTYAAAPRFFCKDLLEHDFGSVKFDRIVLADVIEHLHSPETIYDRFMGLLAPKGKIISTTPARLENHRWDDRHVKEFNREELDAFLSRYPGKVEVQEWIPHPIHLFYKWNVGRLRVGRVMLNLTSLVINPYLFRWRGCSPIMLLGILEPNS